MHMACAMPKDHITSRNRIDIRTEVIIRTKNNLGILRQLIDYMLGIRRRDDYIRQLEFAASAEAEKKADIIIKNAEEKAREIISEARSSSPENE